MLFAENTASSRPKRARPELFSWIGVRPAQYRTSVLERNGVVRFIVTRGYSMLASMSQLQDHECRVKERPALTLWAMYGTEQTEEEIAFKIPCRFGAFKEQGGL